MYFLTPEIFAQATGEETAHACIFEDVMIMLSSQKMNADYLWEGTIVSVSYTHLTQPTTVALC